MTVARPQDDAGGPTYRVVIDGKDMTDRLAPRLSSLSITSQRGDAADQLDLVVTDHDGRLSIPRTGVVAEVSIGWGNGITRQGSFTVDEVEHSGSPDTITITGRSAAVSSTLSEKRERSWSKTTVGAVVRKVAAEHGLKASVSPKLNGISFDQFDQSESDMAMLKRLGGLWDAVATIKGGYLLFGPIGMGTTISGKTLSTVAITRKSGDRHRYHMAKRDAYTGVTAKYHDFDDAKGKGVMAGEKGRVKTLRGHFASEADAKRAAAAEKARIARGAATFELTIAKGRPDIYPEMPVKLAGWPADIVNVAWIVKKVVHTIDATGGFTTSIECENQAAAADSPAQADDGEES